MPAYWQGWLEADAGGELLKLSENFQSSFVAAEFCMAFSTEGWGQKGYELV